MERLLNQQNTKNKTLILFKKGDIMKIGYLAYVIYNLDDGHDFSLLGVFKELGWAVDEIHQEMEDNDDSELISEMNGVGVVYKEYSRSYNIEKIKVEE